MIMKLELCLVEGYTINTKPILGKVMFSIQGNKKQCTKAAKEWQKVNPNHRVAWKWEE